MPVHASRLCNGAQSSGFDVHPSRRVDEIAGLAWGRAVVGENGFNSKMIERCAEIVYAETATWRAVQDNEPEIAKARLAVANATLASSEGRGFAAPLSGDANDPTFQKCIAAAQSVVAEIGNKPATPTVIWISRDNPADDPRNSADEPWLLTATQPVRTGLFLEGAASNGPTSLWVFEHVGDAARLPRRATDVRAPMSDTFRDLGKMGRFILLCCLLLFVAVGYWSYLAGATLDWRQPAAVERALAAAGPGEQPKPVAAAIQASWQFLKDENPLKTGGAGAPSEKSLKAAQATIEKACAPLEQGTRCDAGQIIGALLGEPQNLVWRWSVAMAIVVIALSTLGAALKGTWLGVLIGSRNRLSLARLQLYIWTTIILCLFYVVSLMLVGAAPGEFLVPHLSTNIFLLLGISIGTLPVSGLILKAKETQQASDDAISRAAVDGHRGLVEQRSSPEDWSVLDFFRGEEIADAQSVDPSRFQNLLFTIALATVFIGWCGSRLWAVYLPAPGWSDWAENTVFPTLNATFLSLLAISHAAYLGFKGISRTETQPEAEKREAQTSVAGRSRR